MDLWHRSRRGEHIHHHVDVVGHTTKTPPEQGEMTVDHPAANQKPRVVSNDPVEEDGDVEKVPTARSKLSEIDPR